MSHFTRTYGDLPRIRCRICGRFGSVPGPMLFEPEHPTVAYHEQCLQHTVGDKIDSLQALLEGQQNDSEESTNLSEHHLDIHYVAGLLDEMDTLRTEYSTRIDRLEFLGKEFFRKLFGP